MEKQITDLSILTNYHDRQVIVNYYQNEDFLDSRQGFHFHSIDLQDKGISFTRKNKNNFTISLEKLPDFYVNNEFQNYYILRNSSQRIEIYFP